MSAKVSLYDLLGELVIYRDLDPVDQRLPRFADAWHEMGLSGPARPRKLEPAYAQALAWFIKRARALDAPQVELTELVFIGDNALSDGNAFRSLRTAGSWRGWAFIGAERDEELKISLQEGVYSANRWLALAQFISWLLAQGAALDVRTAVVVDIDKTALGARGRNDGAIDRARVVALEATVANVLGEAFNQGDFRRAYAALNVAKYHRFTADNQDNLAYVCLMLGAGVSTLEDLQSDVASGRLTSFREFMDRVERDRYVLLTSPALRALHDDIYTRVLAGDPTPFKAFRRREYQETVARMGYLPDQAPLAQRLVEEICMTREVMEAANWLRSRECLLIALSDKPGEATMPTPEVAAQGYLPLHRVATHVVGQSISHLLPT
jgi:hypothetical protein